MSADTPQTDPGTLEESIRLLSHQLKSPLDAIRSLLDGITHGLDEAISPQAARLVERAARRAEEARDLVSDLLDYHALGQGGALHQEPLDAFALTARVTASFASPAADKGISLQPNWPEVEAWIRGDPRTLEQALRNLLENAVKYTPPDGVVTVRAAAQDETTLTIQVADTGPGIDAQDLPSLFEPFFRSARHRATVPGTGLGLALARRIVTAHEGSLTVQTEPGKGSTFTVTLPLVRLARAPEAGRQRRRVVIVGGVTAGPKTAARLRRLDPDAEIVMIEKSEFLSYTGCGLPAYVGGRVDTPRELMSTADETLRTVRFFQTIKDVRVLARTLVTDIDRTARTLTCRDLTTGRVFAVPYDALVLATGARSQAPDAPGMELPGICSLYSLEGARELKARLEARGSLDVHVVGAGFIGVSLAQPLVEAGARVTLIEQEPVILGHYFDPDMARRIEAELGRRGVKVCGSTALRGVEQSGDRLHLDTTGGSHHADLVVLATGVIPETELARRAGLAIGSSGGVCVDERLRTSDERIWAVGDCAETVNLASGRSEFLPLGSVSTKMGRVAADAIAGRPASFRGSLGTAMLRIFEVNAARCGLTQARARERGLDAVSATVVGLDRPHYERGAARICLKVTAERGTGRLLGAQGVGVGNVVGRVQILAGAVAGGLTLPEVFELDLGYSPVYTTAIDLAQTACLVLESKIRGDLVTVAPEELAANPVRVVDVSPYTAFTRRSIPGSISVPLESLRREGIPFGSDEEVVLCDATSSGAYEAYRILRSRGWKKLRVLEGGTESWAELRRSGGLA